VAKKGVRTRGEAKSLKVEGVMDVEEEEEGSAAARARGALEEGGAESMKHGSTQGNDIQ